MTGECRSPLGERGLKYSDFEKWSDKSVSLSAWRAWIEIYLISLGGDSGFTSLSAWRAWIEIM